MLPPHLSGPLAAVFVLQMQSDWVTWGDDRFGAGYHYLGAPGGDSSHLQQSHSQLGVDAGNELRS